MSLDLTDEESTLVQVMAWCRQATSHYLSPCWPRSLSPYGVTRPQCVKSCEAITYDGVRMKYKWEQFAESTAEFKYKWEQLLCQQPNLSGWIFALQATVLYLYRLGEDRYRQVSNISHTLAGNKIVDHSDVVGASPVGAAPTTSSFST